MSIGLLDSNFGHTHPAFHTGSDLDTTVFTDLWLHVAKQIDCQHKIAWIVEPPAINPNMHAWIRAYYDIFETVCASDLSLEVLPNFRYVEFGGCWIDPRDKGLHDKTEECSLIASPKRNTVGQRLRHEAIARFPEIEAILTCGATVDTMAEKSAWLIPYRYSVIIENSVVPGYFTEKLLDCIACGTVPLYWGDPTVTDIFETVVPFSTLNDLQSILESPPTFADDALRRDMKRVEFYADPFDNLLRAIA
jgi:hypothetical protein